MTSITSAMLRALAGHGSALCVSIYMPTHGAGPGTREEPIRLRNLLDEAQGRLIESGMSAAAARAFLAPARALGDDRFFATCRGKGIAIFLSPVLFEHFEAPGDVAEAVHVGDGFHLLPLLSTPPGARRFHILALSQNQVRLIEARGEAVRELTLPAELRSLDAFLALGDNPQRGVQADTGGRARGDHGAAHHATAADEDWKADLAYFFGFLDRCVRALIGQDRAPLVLAAVDHVAAIYRRVSGCAHLAAEHLSGNFDRARSEELRDRALPIVEATLGRARDEDAARYRRHAGEWRTSSSIEDTVAAAEQGRVDVLFAAREARRWGSPPRLDGATEAHERPRAGDVELIGVAARSTLRNGGTVHVIERRDMPADSDVAAILRH